MSKYEDDMLRIWQQYQKEVSDDPTDLRDMGAWARSKGFWAPRPVDIDASFAREMA
jgi:hypothetical protein